MAITNTFRGKCPCGKIVLPGRGFVMRSRIVCADCGGEAFGAADEERAMIAEQFEEHGQIYGFEDV